MAIPEKIFKTPYGATIKRITGVTPKLDGPLSIICGQPEFDIFKLEKDLAVKSGNYDPENCIYKGKPNYSFSMFVLEEWGQECHDAVQILCS